MKKVASPLYVAAILCMVVLLVGCISASDSSASGKTYPVSSALQAFYDLLGGEQVLGPAISKLIENPTGQCQYTANVMLCFNPMVEGEGSFSLYPLGNELDVSEVSVNPGSTDGLIVNGFTVYEEFVPFFDYFSQTALAGNPISQVRINYAQQRVEQYFEKVGFYRSFSDAPGMVKLLAYGAAACTKECNYHPSAEAALSNPSVSLARLNLMKKLGGVTDASAFGKALTQPYTAADGNLEQVYPGIVLMQDANGVVQLRPLAKILQMPAKDPGAKLYDYSSGVVFYAVSDSLGYHVPILFDEFINTHGGTAVSGDPINEIYAYEPDLYRQCFANFCLDYDPSKREGNQVSIAPLGKQYLALDQSALPQPAVSEAAPQSILLLVSEGLPKVSASEAQIISVTAANAADQTPLAGIETEITIFLPKEKTWVSTLIPTAADGSSVNTLPILKNIPNGSILAYQVCTTNASGSQACATGSYLVWTYP